MTETVEYRPAKLTPITSPTELREATVRDYVRNAKRMGVDVPTPSLEALAVADLEMVDAYNRGVDRSMPLKGKPKPKPAKAPEAAADEGFKAAPVRSETPEQMEASFARLSARWPFAKGRLKRILAGAAPNRDPILVAMSCEVPDLALAALRLHRNFLMRHRDSRHNPFRGLNEVDCRRAMVRAVEDICDRSAARMGPWWVPK